KCPSPLAPWLAALRRDAATENRQATEGTEGYEVFRIQNSEVTSKLDRKEARSSRQSYFNPPAP
ncbi:MAG: hypothetical protein AB7O68_25080, partial [Pirellulales bacterium]